MCHISSVTSNVSPVTNANSQQPPATATDPPHANSPTMRSTTFKSTLVKTVFMLKPLKVAREDI